jgi:hypothetical protein
MKDIEWVMDVVQSIMVEVVLQDSDPKWQAACTEFTRLFLLKMYGEECETW